jgi:hypothetical protein
MDGWAEKKKESDELRAGRGTIQNFLMGMLSETGEHSHFFSFHPQLRLLAAAK